jgi:N-acetyl-anhydromuramoyl-L-alanine amidase
MSVVPEDAAPVKIDPATGLLVAVRQVLSPFYNARPDNVVPELLIVHGISLPPGDFGGPWIDRLFTGNLPADAHPAFQERAGLRVSAHVLIRRGGELVQYVPFTGRAWHAGVSEYRGRANCNDYSIGVELEGTDTVPYTDAQYEALARLATALFGCYPSLSPERVVGHCDVAPGRKSDPGDVFDWVRLRTALAARLAAG